MKKYLLIILILFSTYSSYSQIVTDTVAKITVISGSSVNFNFSSYTKLRDGISVPYSNGWTTLEISFRKREVNNGTSPSTVNYTDLPWGLYVRSTTADVQNDNGGAGIELNRIVIQTVGSSIGWQEIGINDKKIAEQTTLPTSKRIRIAYKCGVSPKPSVMGKPPGYYFTDLIFTLKKN